MITFDTKLSTILNEHRNKTPDIVYYHGCTGTKVAKIMLQGLVYSHKNYQGHTATISDRNTTYLTRNIKRAASYGGDNNRGIIIVSVNPRSLLMDEDYLQDIIINIADSYLPRDEVNSAVFNKLYELGFPKQQIEYSRDIINQAIDATVDDYLFGDSEIVMTTANLEKWRATLHKASKTLKNFSSYNDSARIPYPITFRGANKIIGGASYVGGKLTLYGPVSDDVIAAISKIWYPRNKEQNNG